MSRVIERKHLPSPVKLIAIVQLSVADFTVVGNGSWSCENGETAGVSARRRRQSRAETQLERMCREGILHVLAIDPRAASCSATRGAQTGQASACYRPVATSDLTLAESTRRSNLVLRTGPRFTRLATGRRSVAHQRHQGTEDGRIWDKRVPIRYSQPSKWLQSLRGPCARRRHLE